jgi:hypothetical protein
MKVTTMNIKIISEVAVHIFLHEHASFIIIM